jgi:nitroimidazol reductase NimA-like FMN-containing flavoprotein (pyridoxamine 5'-phosphate oxidase superfamily)
VPINHWYCPEDGKLYFHGGMQGHRIDAMAREQRASFCVLDDGVKDENDWSLWFRSVIVFGRLEIVEDREKAMSVARQLSLHFTEDVGYIDWEIQNAGHRTLCFALVPEHISGKRIKES